MPIGTLVGMEVRENKERYKSSLECFQIDEFDRKDNAIPRSCGGRMCFENTSYRGVGIGHFNMATRCCWSEVLPLTAYVLP